MAGRIRQQHSRDFWPFYLREHGKPLRRALHCLGTAVGLVLFGAGVVTTDWRLLAGAPVIGYGIVWISHAAVERNWPATFKYPFWSLASDLRMCALASTGRLGRELERHGIGWDSKTNSVRKTGATPRLLRPSRKGPGGISAPSRLLDVGPQRGA